MYQKFKDLNIDHTAIGLIQPGEAYYRYFCTPRGAEIIGWAGVDGIHYCTIPEFGEMIFAVSPMNVGDYVHPIAENFLDLLRLLLSCGDMAALEQCYAWDEEQFKAFLIDYPITKEQQAILDTLREAFDLEPIEDAFAYVKALQKSFDLSKIPYTEDYYDIDMNPAAPVPKEWKVTYDGGFWGGSGKAGEEIPVKQYFRWGREIWYIPAVYLCGKGLVVDFCREVEPEVLLAYIEKWDLYNEEHNHYTKEQQEQMELEHPLRSDFRSQAVVNGKPLVSDHGSGITWVPEACVPEGVRQNREAKQAVEHYGLDQNRCWELRRWTYPWATARKPKLKTLSLELEREPERIPGMRFDSPQPGESVVLTHPQTGAEHTLTVQEYEKQTLPERSLWADSLEYPRYYTAMSYTVEPEISGLMIRDRADSDQPRPKKKELDGITTEEAAALALIGGADGPVSVAAIGVIGGADGPTALIMGHSKPKLHVACSALRFEPAEKVQWQPVFSIKQMEDITVEVLL